MVELMVDVFGDFLDVLLWIVEIVENDDEFVVVDVCEGVVWIIDGLLQLVGEDVQDFVFGCMVVVVVDCFEVVEIGMQYGDVVVLWILKMFWFVQFEGVVVLQLGEGVLFGGCV